MNLSGSTIFFASASTSLAVSLLRTVRDGFMGWRTRSWVSVEGEILAIEAGKKRDPEKQEGPPNARSEVRRPESDGSADALPRSPTTVDGGDRDRVDDPSERDDDEDEADPVEGEVDDEEDVEVEENDEEEEEEEEEEEDEDPIPSVSYGYVAAGEARVGHRVFYGAVSPFAYAANRLLDDRLKKEFDVGSRVTVYFDPNAPAESVLKPGLRKEVLSWALLQAVLLTVCTDALLNALR